MTPAATRADVLTAVARAGSALGEVQRIVAEAQVLYPSTAREIRSGLGDVIAACRSAQAGLQPLAERRDRDVVLASLSDGEQAPPVAMPEPQAGEGVEVMMSVVPKNPYENTSHGTRCFRAGKKELG